MFRSPRRGPCAAPAVSLIALIAALPALAQEAPVGRVVLFEAGLAELTRETGEAREVVLRVPLRDVNDVLKSLLVRGAGITGASLSLSGETPVEDAFASLPFPPAAATDFVALLRSVPGLRVRVTEPGFPQGREGVVMGVIEDCAEERGCETVVTVLGEDGTIRRHVFDADLGIAILDPEINEALARGLGALRQSASGAVREVVVEIEGPEVSQGALSYVVAAPAWKTAYRAVTGVEGEVDLQAWAVIENASGEDWEDVALTLSSGSPVTLTADLHGRDWRYRPVVEPEAPVAMDVQPVMVVEPAPARAGLDDFFGEETEDAMAGGFAPPVAPARLPLALRAGRGCSIRASTSRSPWTLRRARCCRCPS
jgi:hypothetical protein